MTLEQVFIEKLRSLPPAQQQEAINFVDFLASKVKKRVEIAQTPLDSLRHQQPYRYDDPFESAVPLTDWDALQ